MNRTGESGKLGVHHRICGRAVLAGSTDRSRNQVACVAVDEILAVYTKYLEDHGRSEQVAAYETWKGSGVATPGAVLREQDFSIWLDWLVAAGEIDAAVIKPGDLFLSPPAQ